jgi:glycosyltransferase involved in cell wall biosynthesis
VKIVHLSIGALPPPFTTMGGAVQRRVGELALAQARRGHDVSVLAPRETPGRAEVDGVHVRYVRCRTAAPWTHLEFQARALALLAAKRRERPDVVHVHNEPEAGLATRLTGLPAVLTYDNFYFRGGREGRFANVYRRSLLSFDALLPVSRYCRDESVAYWDLPEERVHVVPNGVNVDVFAPDTEGAARERDGFEGPVVLYVGRICRQKGVDTLLDAAGRLPDLGVRANVVLVGPIQQFGPIGQFSSSELPAEQAEWRRRIAEAGAHYLGRVDDARLPGLLTLADVFAMPTRELEMQGMAVLEAQACGTPVVASDHGGLRETVPDGCGTRFPPGDAEALAQALAHMLTDERAARDSAAAAIGHARSLAWERIVDRLTPVYERVAAR